uniref:Ribosomal peptide maturation radical SAM protein 1 n=1 Tax=Candidatus Kentrum sp. TUN TaxID=2126343 RepID=A0A451A3S1_9GAMM|nr:MAG: ribosomal peptide maturation radical SAM protein 1 [Candidatus Kentron sp. TUN]
MPEFKEISHLLGDGDVLLVVPPFLGIERPSMAAHLLQTSAIAAGIKCDVFYANLSMAEILGPDNYLACWKFALPELLGERLFVRAAYRLPAFGCHGYPLSKHLEEAARTLEFANPHHIAHVESVIDQWAEFIAKRLAERNYLVIGLTTTFAQTGASVALINALKKANSKIVTLIGGANCEGVMAEGVTSLSEHIDFVFSGESETAFVSFLSRYLSDGGLPRQKIITSRGIEDLDALETPAYDEYVAQYRYFLASAYSTSSLGALMLPYETSRGCWWGDKHPCRFCGLNGTLHSYRQKSPDRVIKDLRVLTKSYPTKEVFMTDNIMPNELYRGLLQTLHNEFKGIKFSYEVKSNITPSQLRILKDVGFWHIQPGIEAISTPLLRRMRKGVLAWQNIRLLRFARILGLGVSWNLLLGFPGDKEEDYLETMQLITKIVHLQPPLNVTPINIDRFSEYFDNADAYGIDHLRPLPAYSEIYPEFVDLWKIAYHFTGNITSPVLQNHELKGSIILLCHEWNQRWQQSDNRTQIPTVFLQPHTQDLFLLLDTRTPSDTKTSMINRKTAMAIIVDRVQNKNPQQLASETKWGLDENILIALDGRYVSLVIADIDVVAELESGFRCLVGSQDIAGVAL